jgi:hypothetical protein
MGLSYEKIKASMGFIVFTVVGVLYAELVVLGK